MIHLAVSKDALIETLGKYRAAQVLIDDDKYDGKFMKKGEASNYTLPTASSTVLGGVKVGSNISVNNGTISIPAASTVTAGVVKIGSNISVNGGTISLTKANVTAALGYTPPETNTTYGVATSSVAGVVKIGSNIAVNNGTISIPAASTVTAGVVKIGSNISVNGGTISLTKANVTAALGYTPPTSDTQYTLPKATASDLGGVIIGNGLSVLSSGKVSLAAASTGTIGGVKVGANLTVSSAGVIGIPAASANSLGAVKIGSNISVSGGVISLTKANVTNALGYTPPSSNTEYTAATTSKDGLMSAADKTKLNGVATGANVNVIESVKVNNTALTVTNKAVNIDLSTYALKSELGSGQVTLGTAASTVEGALWLVFN